MSGCVSCSVWDILKTGRKRVSRLWLICCVNMMWAFIADQSWNYGTSGQIWNNDLLSLQIRQLTQIPLRAFLWGRLACAQFSVRPRRHPLHIPVLGWINIKLSLSIVSGSISSTESSVVRGLQLTELWDFNRFTSEDWFPVVMRNAQAMQQPRFNHLSGW